MNERIKELELQCYVTITKAGLDGHHEKTTTTFDKEKFAELIVRECLETIEEMDPHSAMRNIDDIYVAVKKHFGVEE